MEFRVNKKAAAAADSKGTRDLQFYEKFAVLVATPFELNLYRFISLW